MIQPDKLDRALEALHRVLVRARNDALLAKQNELATVLDHLEILPSYIADPRFDRTDDFRTCILDIAKILGKFESLVDSFDENISIVHRWY